MAIKKVNSYQFNANTLETKGPHFAVDAIEMDTACIVNENKIAEYYRIYWIENGSGTYQIDFKPFSIEKAGLFFLSPGQVLQVEAEKVKSAYQISFDQEFYCVETHGKAIACNGVLFNNVHRATMIPLDEADAPVFRNWIEQMIQELENPGPGHQELIETYLRMVLIAALRKLEPIQKVSSTNNKLTADFIASVDKFFRKKHAVSEYASMLGVSPKSLSKRLQAEGYTKPINVIRDRIILQAKRDLRYSEKSIKSIAHDLGFEDPAYFSRYFKKATSQSPKQYLESIFE